MWREAQPDLLDSLPRTSWSCCQRCPLCRQQRMHQQCFQVRHSRPQPYGSHQHLHGTMILFPHHHPYKSLTLHIPTIFLLFTRLIDFTSLSRPSSPGLLNNRGDPSKTHSPSCFNGIQQISVKKGQAKNLCCHQAYFPKKKFPSQMAFFFNYLLIDGVQHRRDRWLGFRQINKATWNSRLCLRAQRMAQKIIQISQTSRTFFQNKIIICIGQSSLS